MQGFSLQTSAPIDKGTGRGLEPYRGRGGLQLHTGHPAKPGDLKRRQLDVPSQRASELAYSQKSIARGSAIHLWTITASSLEEAPELGK